MNRNYYIKQIRDLSKNYDSDAQSKILDELTDKFFDVKGIKEWVEVVRKSLTKYINFLVRLQKMKFIWRYNNGITIIYLLLT